MPSGFGPNASRSRPGQQTRRSFPSVRCPGRAARQRAIQEALPKARQRPGTGFLQRRRPVPFDVACPDRLVQQGLGFQRRDHPPAKRLALECPAPRSMTFSPLGSSLSAITTNRYPPQTSSLASSSASATLAWISGGRPSRNPHRAAVAHLPLHTLPARNSTFPAGPPWLLHAPDQRTRIKARRLTPLLRPFRDLLRIVAASHSHRIQDHQSKPRRILHGAAVARERTTGMSRPA